MTDADFENEKKAIQKSNIHFYMTMINLVLLWGIIAILHSIECSHFLLLICITLAVLYTISLNLKIVFWQSSVNNFLKNYDIFFKNETFTESIINYWKFDSINDINKINKEKHIYLEKLIKRYKWRIRLTKINTICVLTCFILFLLFI